VHRRTILVCRPGAACHPSAVSRAAARLSVVENHDGGWARAALVVHAVDAISCLGVGRGKQPAGRRCQLQGRVRIRGGQQDDEHTHQGHLCGAKGAGLGSARTLKCHSSKAQPQQTDKHRERCTLAGLP
jgi:hypothetical protein